METASTGLHTRTHAGDLSGPVASVCGAGHECLLEEVVLVQLDGLVGRILGRLLVGVADDGEFTHLVLLSSVTG